MIYECFRTVSTKNNDALWALCVAKNLDELVSSPCMSMVLSGIEARFLNLTIIEIKRSLNIFLRLLIPSVEEKMKN